MPQTYDNLVLFVTWYYSAVFGINSTSVIGIKYQRTSVYRSADKHADCVSNCYSIFESSICESRKTVFIQILKFI